MGAMYAAVMCTKYLNQFYVSEANVLRDFHGR